MIEGLEQLKVDWDNGWRNYCNVVVVVYGAA